MAAKPQSKLAQENMDMFKEQWEKQVRVLTDAVDDITSIDDFLAVSGNGLQNAKISFMFSFIVNPATVVLEYPLEFCE